LNPAWSSLLAELARWQERGSVAELWWRDDDAGKLTPALSRLLGLAQVARVPLALAAVPMDLEASILDAGNPLVTVLQHGVDHQNRAAPGAKKTEFAPDEGVESALQRLLLGRARLELIAPGRVLPVLVPPWNRVSSPDLLRALAGAGYRALSRFGPRGAVSDGSGLRHLNTHVDIIDWRGNRGFAGEELVLAQAVAHLQARRLGLADALEPTGFLTHHAVHDAAAWSFLQALFERTADLASVRWVRPEF